MSKDPVRIWDEHFAAEMTIGWYEDGDAVLYTHAGEELGAALVLKPHQLQNLTEALERVLEHPCDSGEISIGSNSIGEEASVRFDPHRIIIEREDPPIDPELEINRDDARSLLKHLIDSDVGGDIPGMWG